MLYPVERDSSPGGWVEAINEKEEEKKDGAELGDAPLGPGTGPMIQYDPVGTRSR